jgi:polysaccharide biosynthesis/export protein
LEKELTPLPMKSILMVVMAMFLLSSCGSKFIYFQQNKESKNSYENIQITTPPNVRDHIIDAGDVLQIKLYSNDPELTSIFNNTLDEKGSIAGFQVKSNGAVFIPFVGSLTVKDLSLNQAEILVKDSLNNYINSPNLALDLVAFQVIILGAVKNPGPIIVPSDQASIVNVLALAGDLTGLGNPRNIKLIRETDGKKENHFIDLSNVDVFSNLHYYIESNDIIYVETLKKRFMSENLSYISILSALVNTLLLVSLRI